MENEFATHSHSCIKLLIVSVGSLVGQNILDALEFDRFKRRHIVRIAGTNSIAENANNFRCEECYKVPPTASPEYAEAMRRVLVHFEPDLVLSARDADTAAMWDILQREPGLPGRLPYGNRETIRFALDKGKTAEFCLSHQLPFAETLVTRGSSFADFRGFAAKVGYPVVAKPQEGFASKGVFFIRNEEEARSFVDSGTYIIQEYLGDPEGLRKYFDWLNGPAPLFAEVPDVHHHTCHIPIDPDGRVGEIFVLRNHHNFGAVTRMQRVAHPELEDLAMRFARAFVAEGGAGPLSVQFRPDRQGRMKAQEMNLRTTGSTFARLMMGQDELGFVVNGWLPDRNFPVYRFSEPAYDRVVTKSLYSYESRRDAIEALDETGYWTP